MSSGVTGRKPSPSRTRVPSSSMSRMRWATNTGSDLSLAAPGSTHSSTAGSGNGLWGMPSTKASSGP